MSSVEHTLSYFPEINPKQIEQLKLLGTLYTEWNSKVNVISRKDISHFYSRHVLHSLSIGLYFNLDNSSVLDIGTGGGFPGVPLAILFPEAQFKLVDSIVKKLKVVDAVCDAIGLKNVETAHSRMEDINGEFRFITGRAVKSFPQLYKWTQHLIPKKSDNRAFDMLYLKGGEFREELEDLPLRHEIFELSEHFGSDDFFETKKLVRLY